jgi:hypothetical protein
MLHTDPIGRQSHRGTEPPQALHFPFSSQVPPPVFLFLRWPLAAAMLPVAARGTLASMKLAAPKQASERTKPAALKRAPGETSRRAQPDIAADGRRAAAPGLLWWRPAKRGGSSARVAGDLAREGSILTSGDRGQESVTGSGSRGLGAG